MHPACVDSDALHVMTRTSASAEAQEVRVDATTKVRYPVLRSNELET